MGIGSKLRHKMGIRPPKEMTYEENQQMLDDLGVMRKKNPDEIRHKEKFAAYGAMAKHLSSQKDDALVPEGYEQYAANGSTPYVYNRHAAKPDTYNVDSKEPVAVDPYNPYKSSVAKHERYENENISRTADSYNPYSSASNANPYSQDSTSFSNKEDNEYSSNMNPYSSDNNRYSSTSTQVNYSSNDPYASSNNKYNRANAAPQNTNPYSSPKLQGPSDNQNPRTVSPYTSARINPYRSARNVPSGNDESFDFENAADKPSLKRAPTSGTDFNSAPTFGARSGMQNNYSSLQEYDEDGDLNASIHPEDNSGYYGSDQQQMYPSQQPIYADDQYDDLNNEPEHQDNNYVTFEDMQRQQQEQQQREEEEEVDTIKQQIKFTKQSSAASTRNTLKMARDAEVAGMNTLGMLGSQSEKLGNIETNLTLLKIQNREADDKVSELKKLNRSVFAVHVSNPFTSKRRAKELEERIKNQREMDKEMQHETRMKLYDSTNAVSHAMTAANDERLGKTPGQGADSIRERYSRNEILNRNKKYNFEGDEEDEDLEVEIDRNLNEIGAISKRLKNIALSQSEEVNKQQKRLNEIEGDTDDLDIKLYWNTKRLQNIK